MNLKEALARGKLKEFAKEHEIKPAEKHPLGKERFDAVMDAMAKGVPPQAPQPLPKPKGTRR